ncbi:TolC family protein [Persicimonas caeni]|uniref:TolC family protein n=1 Tax=Persicimonas caeni TaxID=2292766 RepID=UPI00143D2644|nr:TolC family protein [Persicimonas caeni]
MSIIAFTATVCVAASTADAQQRDEEPTGEPVTLTELFEFAEESAPDIQQARERLGLGDAAIEGAERFQPFNPEIEGEFGVGLDDVGLSRAEITLTQRLEIAGERGLRIDAARQQKEALQAELARARWDVHQQVHRLYRQGLVDTDEVEIERDVLDFTQALFEVAEQRFEAGEEPRTSVIVARAEVAQARQRLLQAQVRALRTRRDLGAVVGWTKQAAPQPTGEPEKAKPVPAKERLVEKAIAQDPQLAVLRARLEQARADLALEEREVWPAPLIGVGYERENLASTDVENKLRLVVGVPLPLWDRNQGEIAAAKTRTDILRQAIEDRKKVLGNLVVKQAASVQAAYGQTQIYQEEVLPALETQLDLLQEGFKLGELSLLDVMNARDRLLAVQRQYLAALDEYYAAVSELEALLGTAIWQANGDE